MTPEEQFLQLFQGRTDAIGGDEGRAIYKDVTVKTITDHLAGTFPCGLYPIRFKETDPDVTASWTDTQLRDNMWVKWGCGDIDTGDWSEAYNLAVALRAMGLRPWVERSRSKGWHVWVFSDKWVHAWVMRRCFKVAYQAIGLVAKEANPKSEILRPNQLGNYVRLPYNGAANPGRQTMMDCWCADDDGFPVELSDWLIQADYGMIVSDRNIIAKWAAKWYEPPRPKIILRDIDDTEAEQLINSLPHNLRTLYQNGPKSGDTSQGLMALGYNMAQQGFKPEDTYAVIVMADAKWGKYAASRNNPEDYYRDIIDRSYNG